MLVEFAEFAYRQFGECEVTLMQSLSGLTDTEISVCLKHSRYRETVPCVLQPLSLVF